MSDFKISRRRASFFLFCTALVLSACDAYVIGPVPLSTFAYLFFFALLLILHKRPSGRLASLMLATLGLLLLSLVGHAWFLLSRSGQEMVPLATTSYPIFITLRYIYLVGFAVAIWATYEFGVRHSAFRISTLVVWTGTFIALFSLYTYVSQLYGLWEPPRTRMGTGGQDYTQNEVIFSYGFHRLTGTFREPGHFAQWIFLPFVLSIATFGRNVKALAPPVVMGLAFLLTGSVLGILALMGGLLGFGFFSSRLKHKAMIIAVSLGAAVVISIVGLFQAEMIGAVAPRLVALFSGGVMETNRAYIYIYVMNSSFPVLGYGLGNSSLVLANYLGSILIPSHLSLYLNYLYSTGVLGLLLVVCIVIYPFLESLRLAGRFDSKILVALGVSSGGWVIIYAGDSEQFKLIHGVLIGLVVVLSKYQSTSKFCSHSKLPKCSCPEFV